MEEAARISRLRDLALDRIKQPEVFTQLTQLASEMFDCPVALISVVEEQHLWFLGKTGSDLPVLLRKDSFCSLCVEKGEPLLVSDARQDLRFKDHSFVWRQHGPRSYLGVPVTTDDGTIIGVMCCIAQTPRAFQLQDIPKLATLAALAEQCINAHAKALELARANTNLARLNNLFKQAETAAQIGSWRVDLASDELHWSDQVFHIHGVPIGTPLDVPNAIQFYEPEDRLLVQKTLDRVMEDGEPFSFEATIRRQDGQLRRIRSMGERIDVDGVPESLAGVFIDCTEEHLRTIALQRAATRDPLTGLYNRSEFDRRLVEALNNRKQRGPDCSIAVLLLDLDGFKDVNDRLGHLVGDRLLVQIAQTLDRTIDNNSFLARWGGDEFAVLFPTGCPLAEARTCAEELIAAIAEQVELDDEIVQIGATCGFAEMVESAAPEELMRRADLALYHGKANGRSEVHCWSEEIETVQAARQAAIAQLTEALNNGRAFAAYQPIVSLETGEISSVEALMRLRDRNGQVISAGDFYPALMDPLLARRVSRFMLKQVTADAKALLDLYGPKMRIGINVSEADLSRDDFMAVMEELVAKSALQPSNIVLEVTETMLLLDESGRIRDLLNRLDMRGFTIALDDFGTGFSSLTHLRDFPIRKVKIDKDFIASMSKDHQSRLIVQAMVQMGQSLGIRMVAEGVENEEQHIFLRSIGCSNAQGFHYSHPGSVKQLQERQMSMVPRSLPKWSAA
ncbi:MAG: EAL domain-containing protein [Pseudomonadota bacterium]